MKDIKGLTEIESYMKSLSKPELHSLEMGAKAQHAAGNMSAENLENFLAKASAVKKLHRVAFSFNATRILTTGNSEITSGGLRIALPAPFFLLSDFALGANYIATVSSLIAGYVGVYYYGATTSLDGRSILLTYGNASTVGAASIVETVQLSMSGINKSYPTLLNGTQSANGTLTDPTLGLSNQLQQLFFSSSLLKLYKSMIGAISQDDFVPNQYAVEIAQNPYITKIDEKFEIDNEKGFCFLLVPNVTAGGSQSNGQMWTATMNCFSNDWHKVTEHQGGN